MITSGVVYPIPDMQGSKANKKAFKSTKDVNIDNNNIRKFEGWMRSGPEVRVVSTRIKKFLSIFGTCRVGVCMKATLMLSQGHGSDWPIATGAEGSKKRGHA